MDNNDISLAQSDLGESVHPVLSLSPSVTDRLHVRTPGMEFSQKCLYSPAKLILDAVSSYLSKVQDPFRDLKNMIVQLQLQTGKQ